MLCVHKMVPMLRLHSQSCCRTNAERPSRPGCRPATPAHRAVRDLQGLLPSESHAPPSTKRTARCWTLQGAPPPTAAGAERPRGRQAQARVWIGYGWARAVTRGVERVVVYHVQDHAQATAVQRLHHGAELAHARGPVWVARVAALRHAPVHRVVAPARGGPRPGAPCVPTPICGRVACG